MGKSDGVSIPATRGRDGPSQPKRGWHQRATQAVEDTFFWSQVWPNLSQALSKGHSAALSHPPRGQHSQNTGCAGSIRSRSGSCCVDASNSPFRAPADVAASWTSMAAGGKKRRSTTHMEEFEFHIVRSCHPRSTKSSSNLTRIMTMTWATCVSRLKTVHITRDLVSRVWTTNQHGIRFRSCRSLTDFRSAQTVTRD